MNDKEIKQFARSFRSGILGNRDSWQMCYAVSAPLQSLLSLHGVTCELKCGWINLPRLNEPDIIYAHYWIRLEDGRILDCTGDQFMRFGGTIKTKVYIGEKPDYYYEVL